MTGVAFGAVVSPAALGLYGLYFVGPMAAVFGLIGLLLVLLHGEVGYSLAIRFGVVPSHTVVTGIAQHAWIEVFNALVWSIAYGILGWIIDRFRASRDRPTRPTPA